MSSATHRHRSTVDPGVSTSRPECHQRALNGDATVSGRMDGEERVLPTRPVRPTPPPSVQLLGSLREADSRARRLHGQRRQVDGRTSAAVRARRPRSTSVTAHSVSLGAGQGARSAATPGGLLRRSSEAVRSWPPAATPPHGHRVTRPQVHVLRSEPGQPGQSGPQSATVTATTPTRSEPTPPTNPRLRSTGAPRTTRGAGCETRRATTWRGSVRSVRDGAAVR